jgi:hypothetical protein
MAGTTTVTMARGRTTNAAKRKSTTTLPHPDQNKGRQKIAKQQCSSNASTASTSTNDGSNSKENNESNNNVNHNNNDNTSKAVMKNKISVNVITMNQSVANSSLTSRNMDHAAVQLSSELNREGIVSPRTTESTIASTTASQQQDSYVQWREEQGGITTFENDKRLVQRHVRDTLFSMVKFIRCDSELDYTGKCHFLFCVAFFE